MTAAREVMARVGCVLVLISALQVASAPDAASTIHGDEIVASLEGKIGDAARGRALVVARDPANCVLCHAVPDPALSIAGNVGPSLAGVGSRFTVPQLRLRIVDITRIQPEAVMPSYFRADKLSGVAVMYRGRTVLTAQEVEDVVAYLATLK